MNEKLEEKYARLWHTVNDFELPETIFGTQPYSYLSSPHDYMVSGAFQILNEMAKDGLISQALLRKLHDEENGWKPGHSRITIL